jgi:hypothetical protein
LVKKNGVGVEKSNIIGSQPSVEEGITEMLNIHMCLTSRICEQAGCWRNRVFFGHFETFVNCGFPASAKKTSMSRVVFLMHYWGFPAEP